MKLLCISKLSFLVICIITLSTSCKSVVTEFDCGEVETEILDMFSRVGSYSSSFSNNPSTNYEEAAIAIYIENIAILTETETSCFSFTSIPKVLIDIGIISSATVTSNNTAYMAGDELNGLFKLHTRNQEWTISDFINAHQNDPTLFHLENDEIVFQLTDQPDIAVNQSFSVIFTFDSQKVITIEVPVFEVSD